MTTDALATTSKESTAAAIYQSPAAILRPTTARYPELGRIRAGIKIIKRQWNQATGKADLPPDAKDQGIYNKMMDEGASWDDIETRHQSRYFTEANTKNHKVKRKLIPVNIPYFFCGRQTARSPRTPPSSPISMATRKTTTALRPSPSCSIAIFGGKISTRVLRVLLSRGRKIQVTDHCCLIRQRSHRKENVHDSPASRSRRPSLRGRS